MTKKVFTETSDFYAIDYGSELHLPNGKRYSIIGNSKERRFGVEDPKFWVKNAIDLDTQEKKIIKIEYFESFITTLSGVHIRCFRDPKKEADILDLVKGHPLFMHGTSCFDPKGFNVRILDIVRGQNLYTYIEGIDSSYSEYYHNILPEILTRLLATFEALQYLNASGFRHGDVRNDHIIIENNTGNYVWIDFDYDYESTENPFALDIFGVGNILLYTIGKGFHTLYMIDGYREKYGDLVENLYVEDFSLLDKWRYVNLKNVYPVISDSLNNILLHFSKGSEVYYESVQEVIDDLKEAIKDSF
jgi:hypothetical protein